MESILTTKELIEVFKTLKLRISKQGIYKHEAEGRITPYFKTKNLKLWRVDHAKAFVALVSKNRKRKYDAEDTDNVIKFVIGKRNGNS